MTALTFSHDARGVIASDGPRDFRVPDFQCEQFLGLFRDLGMAEAHDALAVAYEAAGGVPSVRSAA